MVTTSLRSTRRLFSIWQKFIVRRYSPVTPTCRGRSPYCSLTVPAYFEMLARDRERLADARKRVNVLPLGAALWQELHTPLTARPWRANWILHQWRETVWMQSVIATSAPSLLRRARW